MNIEPEIDYQSSEDEHYKIHCPHCSSEQLEDITEYVKKGLIEVPIDETIKNNSVILRCSSCKKIHVLSDINLINGKNKDDKKSTKISLNYSPFILNALMIFFNDSCESLSKKIDESIDNIKLLKQGKIRCDYITLANIIETYNISDDFIKEENTNIKLQIKDKKVASKQKIEIDSYTGDKYCYITPGILKMHIALNSLSYKEFIDKSGIKAYELFDTINDNKPMKLATVAKITKAYPIDFDILFQPIKNIKLTVVENIESDDKVKVLANNNLIKCLCMVHMENVDEIPARYLSLSTKNLSSGMKPWPKGALQKLADHFSVTYELLLLESKDLTFKPKLNDIPDRLFANDNIPDTLNLFLTLHKEKITDIDFNFARQYKELFYMFKDKVFPDELPYALADFYNTDENAFYLPLSYLEPCKSDIPHDSNKLEWDLIWEKLGHNKRLRHYV